MANTRPWFFYDADLWDGTTWYDRIVAACLRYHDGPRDGVNHVVLRSVKRIAEETGLSENKVRLSLEKLQQWPDQFDPFIKSWQKEENRIILRDWKRHFAKYPTWLWLSKLPADAKDVRMFIGTQFRRKGDDQEELFTCNCFGAKGTSIVKTCYLKGRDYEARRQRLQLIIRSLRKLGLLVAVKEATSRVPMIALLPVEIPERLQVMLGAGPQKPSERPSAEATVKLHGPTADLREMAVKCIAKPRQVHSETPSSAERKAVKCIAEGRQVHTSQSTFQSPVSGSASSEDVVTLPGNREGHFVPEETRMVDLIQDESKVIPFLKWCCEEFNLERGRLPWEVQAKHLVWLVADVLDRQDCKIDGGRDFLVSHFLDALCSSKEWGGIKNLGMRLSKSKHQRMFDACIAMIGAAEEEEESQIEHIAVVIKDLEQEKSFGCHQDFTMDCEPWTENADIFGQRPNWLRSRLEDYERRIGKLPKPVVGNYSDQQEEALAKAYEAAARHIWENRKARLEVIPAYQDFFNDPEDESPVLDFSEEHEDREEESLEALSFASGCHEDA